MFFYDSYSTEREIPAKFSLFIRMLAEIYGRGSGEEGKRLARRRVVVEGEGVKVNRCIIIVLLNKHTCVQASSSRLIKIEFL